MKKVTINNVIVDIEDWVKFVASDAYHDWYGYSVKPIFKSTRWFSTDDSEHVFIMQFKFKYDYDIFSACDFAKESVFEVA